MGYIYKISNDINKNVYIGQTVFSVKYRFKQHLKAKDNYPIHAAIKKYGTEHFWVTEIEECDNIALNEREIYWINFYDSYYHGYNATLGGKSGHKYDYDLIAQYYLDNHTLTETANYFGCSKDTVRAVCQTNNLNTYQSYNNIRKTYDYDLIVQLYLKLQNQREVARIIGCSTDTVQKACIENGIKLLTSGEVTKNKISKPVYQIDITTRQCIQVFSSTVAAAISLGDYRYKWNISSCCCGYQKTAYGYGWTYDLNNIPDFNNRKWKKVVQMDKDSLEILNIYPSGAAAARALNKPGAETILKCCKGKIKTAYGFKWKYWEE